MWWTPPDGATCRCTSEARGSTSCPHRSRCCLCARPGRNAFFGPAARGPPGRRRHPPGPHYPGRRQFLLRKRWYVAEHRLAGAVEGASDPAAFGPSSAGGWSGGPRPGGLHREDPPRVRRGTLQASIPGLHPRPRSWRCSGRRCGRRSPLPSRRCCRYGGRSPRPARPGVGRRIDLDTLALSRGLAAPAEGPPVHLHLRPPGSRAAYGAAHSTWKRGALLDPDTARHVSGSPLGRPARSRKPSARSLRSRPRRGGSRRSHFLSLGGEAGRLWLEECERAGGTELRDWTEQALELLHGAATRRSSCWRGPTSARALEEGPPNAIALLMRRWYYAARARYRYCVEDFARATEDLEAGAPGGAPGGGAGSVSCRWRSQIWFPRSTVARIARTRRRWPEMWRHLEIARAMLEDSEPLCRLSDRAAVDSGRLARFYGPLTGYEWEDHKSLSRSWRPSPGCAFMSLQLDWVYAPAGFIIQCP